MNKVFSYQGTSVTFIHKDGKVMVNATQMAKNFGKRPNDWLNLPSTKEFIGILTDTRKNGNVDFQAVKTVRGGNVSSTAQGTWMHEDVALEFARWLSR